MTCALKRLLWEPVTGRLQTAEAGHKEPGGNLGTHILVGQVRVEVANIKHEQWRRKEQAHLSIFFY